MSRSHMILCSFISLTVSSVSSSSFKIFKKYWASLALKNTRFPTPGISVGSSGARPAAAAMAAASKLSCIWKPPTSVMGVAMSLWGAVIGA